MTLGDLRAATRHLSDDTPVTLLNTYDGEFTEPEDISVSSNAVIIEFS